MKKKQKIKKKKIKTHLILSILTFCIMTPFALFIVNKAIMATFENYKYMKNCDGGKKHGSRRINAKSRNHG